MYVRFVGNVTMVGDEVSDVTSVNTVLQQCTGSETTYNLKLPTVLLLLSTTLLCHW